MPGNDLNAGQHRRLTRITIAFAATPPILVGVAALLSGRAPLGVGEATLLPEGLALTGILLVFAAAVAKRVVASRMVAVLIATTLRQGTALLGFVITLLTGDLVWCITLCVVASLAMLVDWPK